MTGWLWVRLVWIPKGSTLVPLLFMKCIKDLPDNLSSNPNLFADDTSLFVTVDDINYSVNYLKKDLCKIRDWSFLGKWVLTQIPQNRLRNSNSHAKCIG